MAWLEKRNGTYEIVYYTGARKRSRRSCRTSGLRKAKHLLAKFQANEENDRALIPREKGIRFYDHLDHYLKWVEQNRSDAWANKQRMYAEANFKPFFGNPKLGKITTYRIHQYVESRRGKVKNVTVNKELASLKKLFEKAVEWRTIESNPARLIRQLPNDGKIKDRILSLEEIERLLESTDASFRNFLILALLTGLRRSELLNLDWDDINFDTMMIRVRNIAGTAKRTKTGEERYVPIIPELDECLRNIKRHHESKWLFHHKDGSQWKDHRYSLKKALKAAGIRVEGPDNVTLHTFRHSFASHHAMRGTPLPILQKLMGHKTYATTERYAHLQPDSLRKYATKLNGLISNSK